MAEAAGAACEAAERPSPSASCLPGSAADDGGRSASLLGWLAGCVTTAEAAVLVRVLVLGAVGSGARPAGEAAAAAAPAASAFTGSDGVREGG